MLSPIFARLPASTLHPVGAVTEDDNSASSHPNTKFRCCLAFFLREKALRRIKPDMDAIDRNLLSLLQMDSGQTAEKLGEELGLSPSAVTRRIQKLKKEGIIAKEVAILSDPFRASRVTAIVTIQLDRHLPSEADRFRRALRAAREVQLFVEITGASDALLLVSVRDMAHFNAFADELASMPLVRRYETSFIKRTEKFTTFVSLD